MSGRTQPIRTCKVIENQKLDISMNSELCDDPEEYSDSTFAEQEKDMEDLDDEIYNNPNWSFSQ